MVRYVRQERILKSTAEAEPVGASRAQMHHLQPLYAAIDCNRTSSDSADACVTNLQPKRTSARALFGRAARNHELYPDQSCCYQRERRHFQGDVYPAASPWSEQEISLNQGPRLGLSTMGGRPARRYLSVLRYPCLLLAICLCPHATWSNATVGNIKISRRWLRELPQNTPIPRMRVGSRPLRYLIQISNQQQAFASQSPLSVGRWFVSYRRRGKGSEPQAHTIPSLGSTMTVRPPRYWESEKFGARKKWIAHPDRSASPLRSLSSVPPSVTISNWSSKPKIPPGAQPPSVINTPAPTLA